MLVGYARVSTAGQNLEAQLDQLQAAGAERIFEEKLSGRTAKNRPQLQEALQFVRDGDTLLVTRIDRLARSIGDLQDIVRHLQGKGVGLRATEQPFDTGSAVGEALLGMLGVFAQFEATIRAERQAEGIAKAKASGTYKGRPTIPPETAARALEMDREGVKRAVIARELGIGRATLYRILPPKAAEAPA